MSAASEAIAALCERLRSHADNAPEISRQSIDIDAAASLIRAQAERVKVLEAALSGLFARLDHPGNGGQHVNYFLRWPEVEAARAALNAHLIAGAPDLLAALEDAYRFISQPTATGKDKAEYSIRNYNALTAKIRAAIAKATGETK